MEVHNDFRDKSGLISISINAQHTHLQLLGTDEVQ